MKRKQLFEFEDFNWFPASLRLTMTKLIVVLHKIIGTPHIISELLVELKKSQNFDQIVDLGSGSGGPMPLVTAALNEKTNERVRLLLTDINPHVKHALKVNSNKDDLVRYREQSLDAAQLDNVPEGLKTMICSFHHMPPDTARKILKSAQENKQSILIYEIAANDFPFLVWLLFLPLSIPILILMAILFLPFTRPFKAQDILFTWVIPLVPIFYAWDGQASLPRTYSFEDIKNELLPTENSDYEWKIDYAYDVRGKKAGYYIMGHKV